MTFRKNASYKNMSFVWQHTFFIIAAVLNSENFAYRIASVAIEKTLYLATLKFEQ